MKIFISNYRDHWISPYTIIEKIYFWKEIDICNLTPFQERLATAIEPFSKGLKFVLDKIHPRVEYIKIDRWDTWSMDTTLAPIIAAMLRQVKATKQGVPAGFAHMTNPRTGKEISFAKAERLWTIELDKMIFAFETLSRDYEDDFAVGDYRAQLKLEEKIQEGLDSFSKYYRNLWT